MKETWKLKSVTSTPNIDPSALAAIESCITAHVRLGLPLVIEVDRYGEATAHFGGTVLAVVQEKQEEPK